MADADLAAAMAQMLNADPGEATQGFSDEVADRMALEFHAMTCLMLRKAFEVTLDPLRALADSVLPPNEPRIDPEFQTNATELEAALDRAQLDSIEARNPGIDMDEVRRFRAHRAALDGEGKK